MEQAIRPVTLIHKNSLFAPTVARAKANAIWYSLIQTSKLNGLDISKYLNYIFSLLEQRKKLMLRLICHGILKLKKFVQIKDHKFTF